MARYDQQTTSTTPQNNATIPALVNDPVIFIAPPSKTVSGGELWIAVSCTDSVYGGCIIHGSVDGTTYYALGRLYGNSTHGTLTANLASATGLDNTNNLDIDLTDSGGVITSVSSTVASVGDSLCLVGSEFLSYRDATLLSVGHYRLNHLYRGLHDSTPGATSGDPFVLCNRYLFRYPFNSDLVGQTVYIKCQGFNYAGGGLQDLSTVTAYTFTVTHDGGVKALLSDISATVDTLPGLSLANNWSNSNTFAKQVISTVGLGTAPLSVLSTTAVANLNVDMLDGYHLGTSGGAIPRLDAANTWSGTQTLADINITDSITFVKTAGKGIKIDTTSPDYGWHDLIGDISPKASGAGSPTRTLYRGNLYDFAFGANDLCDLSYHIPHDYVPGTDIYIHVHWSHTGTAIYGTASFTFYFTYAKGHNQADFPTDKNVVVTYDTGLAANAATTNITNTPRYRHRVDEIIFTSAGGSASLLDNALLEVDGMILAMIKVTSLPTITGGSLFIHTVDIHYQSTGISTKQKAPNFYT